MARTTQGRKLDLDDSPAEGLRVKQPRSSRKRHATASVTNVTAHGSPMRDPKDSAESADTQHDQQIVFQVVSNQKLPCFPCQLVMPARAHVTDLKLRIEEVSDGKVPAVDQELFVLPGRSGELGVLLDLGWRLGHLMQQLCLPADGEVPLFVSQRDYEFHSAVKDALRAAVVARGGEVSSRKHAPHPQASSTDPATQAAREVAEYARVLQQMHSDQMAGTSSDDLQSPSDGEPGGAGNKRNKRETTGKKWTDAETEMLVQGVETYGLGRWQMICEALALGFNDRTAIDLKDKWRNLAKVVGNPSVVPRSVKLSSQLRARILACLGNRHAGVGIAAPRGSATVNGAGAGAPVGEAAVGGGVGAATA